VLNYEKELEEIAVRPQALDELSWLQHRTAINRELTNARGKLRELEEHRPTVEDDKERRELDLVEAQEAVRARADELQRLEKQLRALRESLVNSTSARAHTVLKAI
jgi:predicted nuclease with TOPRIM domain